MPYEWISPEDGPDAPMAELHLWPYRSLPKAGFVVFIGLTIGMIALPLAAMIGTRILWALLPFLAAAVAGLWYALSRSYRDGSTLEILTLRRDRIALIRHNPRGPMQEWQANPYWTTVQMHTTGGPVPHYLTLKGDGREVEIGAFLSEEERCVLEPQLNAALIRTKSYGGV
jgi:uncharacterized membrane protein